MLHKARYGVAVAMLAVAMIGGCSQKITASSVRSNPSPELQSMALTHEQRKNNISRSKDITKRQVWDDFDSIMLQDRPSRLSRYPVP